jgi:RecA/RadA recombinase
MQPETQTQTQSTHKEGYFNMFQHGETLVKSTSKELDQFFEGGLHKGIITQLYGEAGCGKTQLAMLYALGVSQA